MYSLAQGFTHSISTRFTRLKPYLQIVALAREMTLTSPKPHTLNVRLKAQASQPSAQGTSSKFFTLSIKTCFSRLEPGLQMVALARGNRNSTSAQPLNSAPNLKFSKNPLNKEIWQSQAHSEKKDRCLQGSTDQVSTAHKSCTDDHIHNLQCLSHARRIHR